jgi:putative oxidoreductase
VSLNQQRQPLDNRLVPEEIYMSTINPAALGNSAIAPLVLPSPSRRWFLIGGGIAAAASLAAMAMSFTAPDNPDVASAVGLLGRLLITAIFFISGIQKVIWPAASIKYIASVGLPFAPLALVIAIAMELGGGSALLLGYQTRLVAALFVGYCVAAAVFFHRDFKDENQLMNFFKNIAMAGGMLQIIAFGAGSFSLDAVITTAF